MNITKNITPYVVYHEDSIQHALQKISKNSKRLVYCLSDAGVVEGMVTDGDFRRWVVEANEIDIQRPVKDIANTNFLRVKINSNDQYIESQFNSKITSIPIIDDQGRLHSIAWSEAAGFRFGNREIRDDKPSFLIAEIGNNHNGCLDLAKRLIEEAAKAGADCAKFQLRDMDSLYQNGGNSVSEDLGSEYTLDLLRKFQLSNENMYKVLDYTRQCGLIPLCTPWDLKSLKNLDEYGLEGFKIASADLTNHKLLDAAIATRKALFISTGMSLESEIRESVGLLKKGGAAFALLQCNSTYPTPMADVNLAYIERLKDLSRGPVGYSGHERGFEVCIAAVARGARIIEKHFTLDRNMEGNDHRVSLLPDEFASMVRSIRNVEEAIGSNSERTITQGERLNREVLAKSLMAKRPIRKGEKISEAMIDIRSPGRGLQPSRIKDLVGITANRDIPAGEAFYESDICGRGREARRYQISRPWGIPVRYKDYSELTAISNPDFVEFHFSYRDLDLNPSDYFGKPSPIGLVVHSPELFDGEHVMDLSSADDTYRARSIDELQRVIKRTRELKKFFPKTRKPLIIINAGGFSADSFISVEKRAEGYERIADALNRIDSKGVEIIPQTMPPFPWHFGGQRYHNLFMDPQEIRKFCQKYEFRICYDVSHSKLACNQFNWSIKNFSQEIGPYVAHLHIVDARGKNDEGLQIGEGEIDFVSLGQDLQNFMPGISFIPEVWQGHKNAGEGFWIAMDRLEAAFKKHNVVQVLAA